MSELRPCPFCQSVPKVGGGMLVHPICECFGDVYIEWDKWNTRPLEDALQKRVEELSSSISKAVGEINKEWIDGKADGETYSYDDVYQSGIGYALDILHKHGLIGGGEYMLNLTVSDVEFITDGDGGISSSVANKKKVERDMIKDWLTMYDLLKEIDKDMVDGRIYWTEWRDKIRALIGGE